MPWWTDPDALTPPLTAGRLDELIGRDDPTLRMVRRGLVVGAVWHLPLRLTLLTRPSPLLRAQAAYELPPAAGLLDPAALEDALRGTAHRDPLVSVRLLTAQDRLVLLASSWVPVGSGLHDAQLGALTSTLLGAVARTLNRLAEELGLPAPQAVDDVRAAQRAWQRIDPLLAARDQG